LPANGAPRLISGKIAAAENAATPTGPNRGVRPPPRPPSETTPKPVTASPIPGNSAAAGKLLPGQDAYISCGDYLTEIELGSTDPRAAFPIRQLGCGERVTFIRLEGLGAHVRTRDGSDGVVSAWFVSGEEGSIPPIRGSVDLTAVATIWLYRTKSP